MEKNKFEEFLDKYYLAGNTDSAKLVVKDNKLTTSFITADQNVIGEVTLNSFDSPNAELGVYTTSQLLKLLSALDSDINISYGESEDARRCRRCRDWRSTARQRGRRFPPPRRGSSERSTRWTPVPSSRAGPRPTQASCRTRRPPPPASRLQQMS